MTKKAIQVFITGRVQGVGFRYSTYNMAKKLGLKGWVKNTYDGSVEAVFEGDEAVLKIITEWCNEGSPSSRVENIEVYPYTHSEEFNDFSIR